MSGQYPPPNPYSGHHQRAPPSPWAHSHPRHPQTHQSGMVWSPHVGLPARGAQMWPPKPVDSRPRPLYGLQMLMGSPQQEETMDLSASAQDVPKAAGDPLRNGTINGETESVVTSVIATNPFRETPSADPLNCSKRVESSDSSLSISEPGKSCSSSVLVPDEAAVEHVSKNDSTDLDRLSDFSCSSNFTKKTEEPSSQNLESISKSDFKDADSSIKEAELSNVNESHSYLDSSYLSVDTDESRLVVAESSAEDIFGISPVGDTSDMTLQKTERPESSGGVISSACETVSDKLVDSSTHREQWPLRSEMAIVPTLKQCSEPDPSVENVETLLESMFNSQEETSCSSQTSNSGVPQSVIVTNGARLPTDVATPLVDIITPMKEEELAKTLAEDTLPEVDIKEDNPMDVNNESKTDLSIVEDLISSMHEEPKSVIKSPVPEPPNNDDEIKKELIISDMHKNENDKISGEESSESLLQNSIPDPTEDIQCKDEEKSEGKDVDEELLTSNPEPSTSSNPFIEVETQLEKMFAGIVEPLDDVSSDAQVQPSDSDPTKQLTSKKLARKRKKPISRRPSDNSVFGGSSGESVSIKKKGRKRARDSIGNGKGSKKMKFEGGDNGKRGKAVNTNDGLYGKVKGPFLHIEGPKDSPESEVLVNSGSRVDDDDGGDKGSTRRKHSTPQRPEGSSRKAGPAYSSSTLSMRYNSDTPDVTWVCVFCKRGPHCVSGLGGEPAGDLFGPYRVPVTPPSDDLPTGTPADRDIAEEQKRRSGGKFPKSLRVSGAVDTFVQVQKAGKKGKRSASHECLDQPGLLSVGDSYEVWLHEQCAIWAPGLFIIGTQVVGLEDTVWTCLRTKCWQCGGAGAGLGCVVHNCPTRMHYPCAQMSGWLLDNDTFIARCQTHRTRLRP